MGKEQSILQSTPEAKLLHSTTVFLVGNIEPSIEWYERLGFESEYFPPGFAILRRDEIRIFLQQQPDYQPPDDPGRREREAWNVYIVTDNVQALHAEFAKVPGLTMTRQLCEQEYGMTEFEVTDLNGHQLVFAQPSEAERDSE